MYFSLTLWKQKTIILTAYNCKLVRMLFVSHWRTTECVYLHRIHSVRWTHTHTHSHRKEGPHFLARTIDTAATDKLLQKRLHTSYTLVKRKWDGFSKMDGMWLVWWLRVELSEMTHMTDTDRQMGGGQFQIAMLCMCAEQAVAFLYCGL